MSYTEPQLSCHPAGGTLISFTHTAEDFIPGSQRNVSIYIPRALPPKATLALEIVTDGLRDIEPALLEELIADGTVPPMVAIGITAAKLPPLIPSATPRSVRSIEYDTLGPGYARFVIDEIIPAVADLLPEGYTLSPSPDLHAITGCSSGGICAWNACWERNDFFRRCIINSPTFSSFRNGEAYLALIRKYETKPIRCFMTVGTDDMKNSAGDWYLEALAAHAAMDYAGYDHDFVVFPDGKHGVGDGNTDTHRRALAFVWKAWQTEPVTVRHLPERVADIVTPDEPWRIEPGKLPDTKNLDTAFGRYNCLDKNGIMHPRQIFLHQAGRTRFAAKLPNLVSGMAISCDQTRLYVSTMDNRFITGFLISPNGLLHSPFPCAHPHLKDDATRLGATGLCVDDGDRLYVATELGIQTFSCEGHSNCILPLPDGAVPVSVCFDLATPHILHAVTADGTVYSRKVLTSAPALVPTPANTPRF